MFDPKLEILPPAQRALWYELQGTPASFVLYGGTGLSLRLGHRSSVDFDFFSSDSFLPGELHKEISYLRGAERLQSESNTLTCLVQRLKHPVKISFFGGIPFGRVASPDLARGGGIRVASMLDIAATKLKVIQERAEAKDYQDIAALLDHGLALQEALRAGLGIYGSLFNPMISLRALTFFEDGDLQSLGQSVKETLQGAVSNIRFERLTPLELQSRRLDVGGESL